MASTNRDGAEQTEPDRFTAVPNVAVPGITPSPGSGAGSFAFRPRSVLLASRHDKSPSVSVESPTRPHSPASSAFTNPSHSSTSGTPPVDAPAVSTSPPVFGWPPPAVPLDQSSAAVSVSSEVVSAQQQHPAPVEGADEESADADDDDDEEALRAGLPDGFSLKDLDLGIVTTKVVLQTAKDLKSKKRLIIWLWWDSKKRRWVVVFVWAVQQLQGWMDQVVVRDLGWEPGTFQHHVAVAAATANTPHDRIPTLSGVPIDHTLPHVLDNLLHTADAIIGIGTRGFGANLLSLQEVLARIRPILATRNRGHSPSYHMTAQGFSSAVHDVLTRFGFVAAPGPNKPPEPISLPDLIKLFIEKGGAKGLARDKSNTSELVALDLLGFFAQRVGQSQGKALGNLNGNSERFPTRTSIRWSCNTDQPRGLADAFPTRPRRAFPDGIDRDSDSHSREQSGGSSRCSQQQHCHYGSKAAAVEETKARRTETDRRKLGSRGDADRWHQEGRDSVSRRAPGDC